MYSRDTHIYWKFGAIIDSPIQSECPNNHEDDKSTSSLI